MCQFMKLGTNVASPLAVDIISSPSPSRVNWFQNQDPTLRTQAEG